MTTDDKALTEKIARALRAHDAITHGWSGPMHLTVEVRDYLPAAAAALPIIREAQAEAWDEGRLSGAFLGVHANPYREKEADHD